MIKLENLLSTSSKRAKASVIRELLKVASQPGIISFAGGFPDPNLFPIEEIRAITDDILSTRGKAALQYSVTEGEKCLKEEIIKLAAKENVNIGEENILVTTASQQALKLVGEIFLDPGDLIALELHTYLGGLQVFNACEATTAGFPMDENGIKTEKLKKWLHTPNWPWWLEEPNIIKFLYLVPDFQNPTGVTLSMEGRKEIINLSQHYNFPVVEDTPYRNLRYEGKTPPSLFSLNQKNVISVRSFSKIFSPGLRLGWIMAHPDIIQKLVIAKQAADLCTPVLNQMIAAEFLRQGLLDVHLEKLKTVYRKKRDAMLAALDEFMPRTKELWWSRPEGGLFLWLVLPEHINTEELFSEAIKEKVAFVIGSAFYCDGRGHNTMRLNFSSPSEEQIYEGIKRLVKVIKTKLVKN